MEDEQIQLKPCIILNEVQPNGISTSPLMLKTFQVIKL